MIGDFDAPTSAGDFVPPKDDGWGSDDGGGGGAAEAEEDATFESAGDGPAAVVPKAAVFAGEADED